MLSISIPIDILLNNTNVSLKVKDNCQNLISYTAFNVKRLLKCSKERVYYQQQLLPSLNIFIKHMYYHCELTPTILVLSLIYLDRLKNSLPQKSRGEFDTPYKMFIASAILATKFNEDSNKATRLIYKFVSTLYPMKEINEMERSFLFIIKYNLFVNLVEVYDFVSNHKDSLELELGIN